MMLVPAIHFPGTCKEAIAFYQEVLQAEVLSIAYDRDAPHDSGMASATPDHVMHAELMIAGTRVNACDVSAPIAPGSMYLFNLFLDFAERVAAVFHQLAQGGEIRTELGPQFWTPMYGEVVDRFGVHWQLMAENAEKDTLRV